MLLKRDFRAARLIRPPFSRASFARCWIASIVARMTFVTRSRASFA